MEYLILANVILTLLVIALLTYPRIALRGKPVRPSGLPTHLLPPPVETLPAGHTWPEKWDEFDGVMERFVCRDCGQSFLRRRV